MRGERAIVCMQDKEQANALNTQKTHIGSSWTVTISKEYVCLLLLPTIDSIFIFHFFFLWLNAYAYVYVCVFIRIVCEYVL